MDIRIGIRKVRLEQQNNELIEQYMLARILAWRDKIAELEVASITQLNNALDIVARDVKKRLADDAEGLVTLSEWSKTQDTALVAWVDEVTAGARAVMGDAVDSTAITTATASLMTYNNLLSFDGAASAVTTVGLSAEQIGAWFGTGAATWIQNAFHIGVASSLLEVLHTSAIEGKGNAEIMRRLLNRAVDEGMAVTKRDMATLARTYTQTANNMAREAVYDANSNLITSYKRVGALDNHCCLACAVADGAVYKKDEPRPMLPAHPNCVVAETPVFAPDKVAAFISTYSGPVFEIVFSSGANVTVTANHMFLTGNGFVAAHSLRKGDNVFCGTDKSISLPFLSPYNDRNVSRIDDVVEAFSKTSGVRTVSVPTSPEYLHGDGEFIQGNIDVIAPDCLLRGDTDTFINEYLGKDFFTPSNVKSFTALNSRRYFPPHFLRLWLSLNCHMSGMSIFDVIKSTSFGHHQSIGISIPSNTDIVTLQQSSNNNTSAIIPFSELISGYSRKIKTNHFLLRDTISNLTSRQSVTSCNSNDCTNGYSIISRNLRETLKGFTSFANVVDIKSRYFIGHVYDLQTISSLYQINGIVTSNCRCVYIAQFKTWRDFGIDSDDLGKVARPWTMRDEGDLGTGKAKILNYGTSQENYSGWWQTLSEKEKAVLPIGAVRRKLLESGDLTWDDMWDKATGRVKTLEELGFDRTGKSIE